MPSSSRNLRFSLVSFTLPIFICVLTGGHSCSTSTTTSARSSSSSSSCPPFTTAVPPFPFSSSPGCGHPSFQIRCSSPHSVISINHLNFSILHLEPNSTSLILSPHYPNANPNPNCSSSSSDLSTLPNHSINFSGTPFRASDSSCSRLSLLRPCSPPNLPNCSRCLWECRLIKNPAQLVQDCESSHALLSSEQGCQTDVLGFLDSFLKLGIQVEYDQVQDSYFTRCKDCEANNGGICGFNSSDPNKPFLCFHSKSSLSPPWIHPTKLNRIAILSTLFSLTCLLLAFSIGIAIFRSKRFRSSSETELEDPTTLFLHRHRSASLLPPVFSYEELESSTNKFDPKRKIGDGGFGSVYLGQLSDGRIVAVKYLHSKHHSCNKSFSTKSFCNEILILSSIDHPNLVKLHGYCSDPRGLLLVYDYIPNGTLADHLHGSKSLYREGSLTWQVRLDIALQTALAMEYLHFSVVPLIVHRDITSSNIFVEKDMRIKVGDFGLSRLLVLPETSSSGSEYVCTGPQGTPGYLDPDYHRSFRLTEKSDVYSFGVVLLELISGLKAVDQSREKREMALADLVVSKIQMGLLHQVVDPVLALHEEAMNGVDALAELAFRCVAADKDDRPDAKEIVEELKRIGNCVRGGGGGGDLRGSNFNVTDVAVR